MQILQFRGKSLLSRIIQFQTRSAYSHTAPLLDNGTIVEAWHPVGVVASTLADHIHTPGAVVDVFNIVAHYDEAEAERFLMSQVGKRYDYWSVLRFLTRRDAPKNDAWFCSELALVACDRAGVKLLSGNPSHMAPGDVTKSPKLNWAGEIVLS